MAPPILIYPNISLIPISWSLQSFPSEVFLEILSFKTCSYSATFTSIPLSNYYHILNQGSGFEVQTNLASRSYFIVSPQYMVPLLTPFSHCLPLFFLPKLSSPLDLRFMVLPPSNSYVLILLTFQTYIGSCHLTYMLDIWSGRLHCQTAKNGCSER